MQLKSKLRTNFRASLIFTICSTFLMSATSVYAGDDDKLKKGTKLPAEDVQMISIDGDTITLDELVLENGLIVVFSCNTCPFVVGSSWFEGWEGQYEDLYAQAKENEIGFVLVNSNEAKREGDDSLDEMKKHAEEAGYTMDYVVDENSVVADEFHARTTPHIFVFNDKKELIYQGAIDNTWDTKRTEDEFYLVSVMDDLSNDVKIKQKSTSPKGCSIKRVKQ